MAEDYDVVVIGAGFGGTVAAKECADADLETLILERAQKPGHKVISSNCIPIYGFLFGPKWIRDGRPPIERPLYGFTHFFMDGKKIHDTAVFEFAGIPVGYTAYPRKFCTWLADEATKSGAELRTSTTVTDVIKEGRDIRGVTTDEGEKITSKLVIDAEGLQNFIAIKGGLRKKYTPESIELCMLYDFEVPKEELDDICNGRLEYYWDMRGEIIAPLGQGSAVYIFPYRDSVHLTIGRFLREDGKVPKTSTLLDQYYESFFQSERWKEVYEPKAKLRAKVWDTCPLYVGLFPELREMPTCGDGILLIGDSAGLEASAIGDGVPNAWFSAEIASKVAIEAIEKNDTSAGFLKRYDERIRSHPLIPRLITDPHRMDLSKVKETKSWGDLKERVLEGWAAYVGGLTLQLMQERGPEESGAWEEMFERYEKIYESGEFSNYG